MEFRVRKLEKRLVVEMNIIWKTTCRLNEVEGSGRYLEKFVVYVFI